MPRKSTRTASGSSPEKQATSRRNTRRGQKTDEAESEITEEIPAHLLRPSDESSEQSDQDSDYGSPKKGRGRGRGRAKKAKEAVQEEKTEKPVSTRPRRGRRGAAQSPILEEQQHSQESVNSQTTNDEHDASTMESEPTVDKEKSPEPPQIEESKNNESDTKPSEIVEEKQPDKEIENAKIEKDEEPIQTTQPNAEKDEISQSQPESSKQPDAETPDEKIVIEENEKVSEVRIEQDLQSNNDQAPVNEEVKHEDKNVNESNDQEISREENEDDNSEVVNAEIDEKQSVDDEMSKDAPELPMEDDSRSRSNSSERNQNEIDTKEKEQDPEKEKGRRSRSSSGEIHEDSVDNSKMDVDTSLEIQNKKSESPVKKAIKVDRKSPPKRDDDKPTQGLQRKRKWGARKTDDEPVIAITTDSLKNVIAEEVKPVDVKLASSPSPEPEEKRQRVKLTSEDRDVKKKLLKERLRKQEEEEDRRNEQIAKAIERSQISPTIIVTNGAGKDRKVSVVINEENPSPPTPPKNQISRIICITNLVRPLTFMAVKSLVARTGEIEDFWIDAIKSKCFVMYKTEDEAVETRHALHGVKWPEHNLKTLNVEFSTEDEMNKVIEATRGERITSETASNREAKQEKGFGWSKQDVPAEDRSRNSRRVREWDVGKKDESERDEDRENRRRRRSSEQREKVVKRRSVSKSPVREEPKEITPVPQQRLLDDLFRKTKAQPFIYWMPLSEEKIRELEEQRLKNIAEHNRRMEEMVKIQKERREAREQRMREEEKRRVERRDRDRRSRDRRRRSRSRSKSRDKNRRFDRR